MQWEAVTGIISLYWQLRVMHAISQYNTSIVRNPMHSRLESNDEQVKSKWNKNAKNAFQPSSKVKRLECLFFIGPKSDHCLALPCKPFRHSVTGLVEFLSNFWICQSFYMDFSQLLYGFLKIDRWISLSCYIDSSKIDS